MCALRASARAFSGPEWRSGCAVDCRRRYSARRARRGMVNGPVGGGPWGRVAGKRS